MFSSRVLTYSLDSPRRATIFLAAIALPGIVLIAQVTKIAVADHWGESTKLADVSRAARLDLMNPEYQYRLGLFYEFDWEHMDVTEAVRYLKEATTLQPNRADYWSGLGRACFTVGDDSCADQAYENSVRLAPAIPHYEWEIANYYLLSGRQSESLARYRRFLELSPNDATPVFGACLRAFKNPKIIWGALMGTSDIVKLAYIYFLSTHGYPDDAYQFWNETVAGGSNVSFPDARPYLEQLIASSHFSQAFKVWQDLERIGAIHSTESRDSANRIFNGDFEQEPLNAGFDWRYQPQEYLAFDFADTDSHEGHRCLRIDFNVPHNADYEPVYQIVPVEPNQQYVLAAHLRSADITSDSGPRLRVVDTQCPACLSVESEGTLRSTTWHDVSLNFLTGPHTQAVRISVFRPRSRSFPMEIQGHFWLDSASLKAVNSRSQVPGNQ